MTLHSLSSGSMAVPNTHSPYTYGAGILGGDTENKQELWCQVMIRAREEKHREGAGVRNGIVQLQGQEVSWEGTL